jgi:hypothetical protein
MPVIATEGKNNRLVKGDCAGDVGVEIKVNEGVSLAERCRVMVNV